MRANALRRTSIETRYDLFVTLCTIFEYFFFRSSWNIQLDFVLFFSLVLIMGPNASDINIKINPKQHIEGMSFPQDINPFFVDRNKIGNVFIVVFKHPILDRKFAHHAVMVDIAGCSSDSHLSGATIHMTAVASTKVTRFQIHDRSFPRKNFHEIIYVGRLNPWRSSPWLWAFDLQREVCMNWFHCTYRGSLNILSISRGLNYFVN